MISTLKNFIDKRFFTVAPVEKSVVEAYDLWASNYDLQPGNLMLDLDKIVFHNLLKNVEIAGKDVADIGCGTGRHWVSILENEPSSLTGFDVSAGMLGKLNEKYPTARTCQIIENTFSDIADASYNVIVSTLTIAHIENIQEALRAWSRILKDEGEIIITDFHPDALASGGKRTFEHENRQIAVKNFVHPISVIKAILLNENIIVIEEQEKIIDESVRDYYLNKNALHVYEKFKGCRMIYGIRFKKL